MGRNGSSVTALRQTLHANGKNEERNYLEQKAWTSN